MSKAKNKTQVSEANAKSKKVKNPFKTYGKDFEFVKDYNGKTRLVEHVKTNKGTEVKVDGTTCVIFGNSINL
jgi:hypothetical protein